MNTVYALRAENPDGTVKAIVGTDFRNVIDQDEKFYAEHSGVKITRHVVKIDAWALEYWPALANMNSQEQAEFMLLPIPGSVEYVY